MTGDRSKLEINTDNWTVKKCEQFWQQYWQLWQQWCESNFDIDYCNFDVIDRKYDIIDESNFDVIDSKYDIIDESNFYVIDSKYEIIDESNFDVIDGKDVINDDSNGSSISSLWVLGSRQDLFWNYMELLNFYHCFWRTIIWQ